jgi:muramoyltetrapeptide carboxypeptidase LdcA involved in peptidoglycan recycling
METLFVMKDVKTTENSLQTIAEIFDEDEDVYIEKAEILFQSFVNTLRTIDKLSAENKELIKSGLEIVGTNLEIIADLSDKDKVYSRVGMIPQRKNSILFNARI